MSELKLNGKIKVIGEKQTFDSGFEKVEFVITTDDKYPQDVKFEIVKDAMENFLKYNKVGQDVEVSFNIRGNEWKGKHYVSLSAWKVFAGKKEEPKAQVEEEEDSLPF
jgi:hypothetical protein